MTDGQTDRQTDRRTDGQTDGSKNNTSSKTLFSVEVRNKNNTSSKTLFLAEVKSKILPTRGKCEVEDIEGMEVVNEIKYLGVKVGGSGRSIYGYEKKKWKNKAEKLAVKLISQI